MRTFVSIGLAGLALAAGTLDAEARGFRLRLGGLRMRGPATVASIHPDPRATARAAALANRPDLSVGTRPTYVVLPSPSRRPEDPAQVGAVAAAATGKPAAVEAPASVAVETKVAPWCRSQRVVGTGAGFCVIN